MPALRYPTTTRQVPGRGFSKTHTGIDFGWNYTSTGRNVYAAAAGVLTSGWNAAYGNWAKITHDDSTVTEYDHLAKRPAPRAHIAAGELFAVMGNTGALSRATHLHFSYWVKGRKVDPQPALTAYALAGGETDEDMNTYELVKAKGDPTGAVFYSVNRITRYHVPDPDTLADYRSYIRKVLNLVDLPPVVEVANIEAFGAIIGAPAPVATTFNFTGTASSGTA